jgi:hypothetical protein
MPTLEHDKILLETRIYLMQGPYFFLHLFYSFC